MLYLYNPNATSQLNCYLVVSTNPPNSQTTYACAANLAEVQQHLAQFNHNNHVIVNVPMSLWWYQVFVATKCMTLHDADPNNQQHTPHDYQNQVYTQLYTEYYNSYQHRQINLVQDIMNLNHANAVTAPAHNFITPK